MNIRWSPRAKRNLKAIRDYIARDPHVYATRTVQRIRSAVHSVRRWPDSGSLVADDAQQQLREVIVGNYRAIYEVVENEIRVLTVVHAAQDWSPADLSQDERSR